MRTQEQIDADFAALLAREEELRDMADQCCAMLDVPPVKLVLTRTESRACLGGADGHYVRADKEVGLTSRVIPRGNPGAVLLHEIAHHVAAEFDLPRHRHVRIRAPRYGVTVINGKSYTGDPNKSKAAQEVIGWREQDNPHGLGFQVAKEAVDYVAGIMGWPPPI